MIPELGLALLPLLPLLAGLLCWRLAPQSPGLALRLSAVAAVVLALVASLDAVGSRLTLPANRALELSAIGQFGVELLALAMLGLVFALHREPAELLARWLPVAWFSLGGLVTALLVTSLPVAGLAYLSATLLWVFGLAPADRAAASGTMQRYLAFVALAMPLLLAGFRIAEAHSPSAPELEPLALAFLVPAFGLLLGLIPLHGWAMTLASGAPRAMHFGVLTLVQTAGFLLLLRALQAHPWLAGGAREILVLGGTLSVLVGGWLALSARRDDPDDWLAYAVMAAGGLVLIGLGSQTRAAATGALFLLLTRVLALVLMALRPRLDPGRLAAAGTSAGLLTLAGTPGLAGFPGLWLVLQPLTGAAAGLIPATILAGSGLLVATAIRRWELETLPAPGQPPTEVSIGARRATLVLLVVLVALGLTPDLILPALADVLRDMALVR